jgi:glycosyltransferase involved in cell wall biosynthesis
MISVVIPLYNKRGTIIRAIQSVLGQSVLPDEIIVVNDGSTDGSDEIVRNLNNPMIYLINQINGGVSAARNHGIKVSKNEIIAFLDADDEWKPDFLLTIKTLSQTYPDCDVFATSYQICQLNGCFGNIKLNRLTFKESGIFNNYFEVSCFSVPPIWSSAVAVSKKALINIGGFPLGIKAGEDLITWAKLAVNYSIAYNTIPMAIFYPPNNIKERSPRLDLEKDLVHDTLINLYKYHHQKKIKYFRKYIGHWNLMRTSIMFQSYAGSKAIIPALRALWFFGFTKKVFLFLCLSLLPRKVQFYLFTSFKQFKNSL